MGSFTGMLSVDEAPVTIDLDRIAKRNGDSDRYVYWLITNNSYKSIINAFRVLKAQNAYSITSNGLPYESVAAKCSRLVASPRYVGLWPCAQLEMQSSNRGRTTDPVNEILRLGLFLVDGDDLIGGTTSMMDAFKLRRRKIGFAYLSLYNAAYIASFGSSSEKVRRAEMSNTPFLTTQIQRAEAMGAQDGQIAAKKDAIVNVFYNIGKLSRGGFNKDPSSQDFDNIMALHTALTGEDLAGFMCRMNMGNQKPGATMDEILEDIPGKANYVIKKNKSLAEIDYDIKVCKQ
jgi:hypothetical protein